MAATTCGDADAPTTMSPWKVLVTGASGYVGQHLVASLAAAGVEVGGRKCEVYAAYHSLPTFEDDLADLLAKTPLHPSIAGVAPIAGVDFADPDCVAALRTKCGGGVDAIVHLAALSSPGYCEKNPDAARRVNCPLDLPSFGAPIIYMSTDQVYDGGGRFYAEDDGTEPVNVYGKSKLAFERVLAGSEAAPGSVALRSSLVLGPPTPFRNGCRKGAFPSFLQFIESRLRSVTPTDYFTNEFRSVVHVDDVVRAIKHFLRKALSGEGVAETVVYNLGGSDRVSRHEIALAAARRLGLDASSAREAERPSTGGDVPSPLDISMNVGKLAKELGVERMAGLEEIVDSTFA